MIWRLGVKNAFPRVDCFRRDVFIRATVEWRPSGDSRIWNLRASAYGLIDAPAASRSAVKRYSLCALEFQAPTSGPTSYFVFRSSGGAVGDLAANIDDVPGCWEPDIFLKARKYAKRRFGGLKALGQTCARRTIPRFR